MRVPLAGLPHTATEVAVTNKTVSVILLSYERIPP